MPNGNLLHKISFESTPRHPSCRAYFVRRAYKRCFMLIWSHFNEFECQGFGAEVNSFVFFSRGVGRQVKGVSMWMACVLVIAMALKANRLFESIADIYPSHSFSWSCWRQLQSGLQGGWVRQTANGKRFDVKLRINSIHFPHRYATVERVAVQMWFFIDCNRLSMILQFQRKDSFECIAVFDTTKKN